MPVRGVGIRVRLLLVPPATQTLPQITRVESEHVADVAEAARPAQLLGAHPFLGFSEQAPTAPTLLHGVALERDDRLLEHREEEALLRNQGRVEAAAEELGWEHHGGFEIDASTTRRIACPATRCVHGWRVARTPTLVKFKICAIS